MKRRSFLQLLAAFAGIPVVAKTVAKPTAQFIGQNSIAKSAIPTGTIQPFCGQYIPNGWLPCDGRVISPNDYPELHKILGSTLPSGYSASHGEPMLSAEPFVSVQHIIKT